MNTGLIHFQSILTTPGIRANLRLPCRSHKISRKEVTRDHVPTFRFPVLQKSKIPDILLFEFIQDNGFLLRLSQVLRVKTRTTFSWNSEGHVVNGTGRQLRQQ